LRPVYLKPAEDAEETRELRILRAYKSLCTPDSGDETWPALSCGPENHGPFQRGWQAFLTEQQEIAERARKKCLLHCLGPWSLPSLWDTVELEEFLAEARSWYDWEAMGDAQQDARDDEADEVAGLMKKVGRAAQGVATTCWPCVSYHEHLLTVEEYCALETVKTATHFDGIATARSEKPPREIDRDAKVAEQPIVESHGADDQAGDAQVEAAEQRARAGLALLGQNTVIAHRFEAETLEEILAFATAERTQAFVKELQETALMSAGELPPPA
jgi:hypothetical protein